MSGMSEHVHKWDYVSHWPLLTSVMVRRVCPCGYGEDAEIKQEQWEKWIPAKLSHEGKNHKCKVGCPSYNSGHSIDADGNCNMGCC